MNIWGRCGLVIQEPSQGAQWRLFDDMLHAISGVLTRIPTGPLEVGHCTH